MRFFDDYIGEIDFKTMGKGGDNVSEFERQKAVFYMQHPLQIEETKETELYGVKEY